MSAADLRSGHEDDVPGADADADARAERSDGSIAGEEREVAIETPQQTSVQDSGEVVPLIGPGGAPLVPASEAGDTQGARAGTTVPVGPQQAANSQAGSVGAVAPGHLPVPAETDDASARGPALPEVGPDGTEAAETDTPGLSRRAETLSPGQVGGAPGGLVGAGAGTRVGTAVPAGVAAASTGTSVVEMLSQVEGAGNTDPWTADMHVTQSASRESVASGAPVATATASAATPESNGAARAGGNELRADRVADQRASVASEGGADGAAASAATGAATGANTGSRTEMAVAQTPSQHHVALPSATGSDTSSAVGQGNQGLFAGSDGLFAADPLVVDGALGEARLSQSRAPGGTLPVFQSADTPRQVAMQIAEVVRASGERAVELRLQPEELGRVQLTMSQDAAGTLTVSLNVERPETLDLLRRNIDLLSADLRELGYSNIDFAFRGDGSGGEASQERAGEGGSARPVSGATTNADMAATSHSPDPGRLGDGIDIRL